MTRRSLLLATALVVVAALAVVTLVTTGDGDGDDGVTAGDRSSPTQPGRVRGDDLLPTTTGPPSSTPETGGPVASEGAVVTTGALLSVAVDGAAVSAQAPPCDDLVPALDVSDCRVADGSGGRFAVVAGVLPDGARQVRLFAAAPGGFRPVLRTEPMPADVEVFGVALQPAEVGGEPVVAVDYDFNGSGAVHSFEVVAWDRGAEAPGVVAFVEGQGLDRLTGGDGRLRVVSANYDDGAPTCCPQQADVRTVTRSGPGRWNLTTETVPFASAP